MSEAPVTPLAAAVARVGDRWTMLLVEALLEGPRRFNDLIEALPGIAPNILSQRLKLPTLNSPGSIDQLNFTTHRSSTRRRRTVTLKRLLLGVHCANTS